MPAQAEKRQKQAQAAQRAQHAAEAARRALNGGGGGPAPSPGAHSVQASTGLPLMLPSVCLPLHMRYKTASATKAFNAHVWV